MGKEFELGEKKEHLREFPGSPVVKTQHFHCCGLGISPWLDNKDPISLVAKKRST